MLRTFVENGLPKDLAKPFAFVEELYVSALRLQQAVYELYDSSIDMMRSNLAGLKIFFAVEFSAVLVLSIGFRKHRLTQYLWST